MSTIHLNITQACNQKCFFCVRSMAPTQPPKLSTLIEYASTQRKKGATSCIITGGEPFVSPFIFDLLKAIKEQGYARVTIQTNAVMLSSPHVVEAVSNICAGMRCDFSISLHTLDEALHEAITGKRGHIEKIKEALCNLKAAGLPFCTNTVIFKRNVNQLKDVSQYAYAAGAYLIQFSLMRYSSKDLAKEAVSLCIAREAAHAVGTIIPKDKIRFEGIPFCLLRGMERSVAEAYWPHELKLLTCTGKRIENYKDDLMPQYRFKLASCASCMMSPLCMGVWEEYKNDLISLSPKPIG